MNGGKSTLRRRPDLHQEITEETRKLMAEMERSARQNEILDMIYMGLTIIKSLMVIGLCIAVITMLSAGGLSLLAFSAIAFGPATLGILAGVGVWAWRKHRAARRAETPRSVDVSPKGAGQSVPGSYQRLRDPLGEKPAEKQGAQEAKEHGQATAFGRFQRRASALFGVRREPQVSEGSSPAKTPRLDK